MDTESNRLAHEAYLELCERIKSGDLAPGKQLPTYDDLAMELQVDRKLILKAVQQLEADGYLYQKKGELRWYVNPWISRRGFIQMSAKLGIGAAGLVLLPTAVNLGSTYI